MTYQEFNKLRSERKISMGINHSIALKLVDLLPKNYQYAHIFWSWIWVLSVPTFLLIAILYKWWVGLSLLIFITPLLFSSIKKSAAQFVIQHAEENQDFFEYLVKNELLLFKKPNNS